MLVLLLTKEEAKILLEILDEWYKEHEDDIMDFSSREEEYKVYIKIKKTLKEQLDEEPSHK